MHVYFNNGGKMKYLIFFVFAVFALSLIVTPVAYADAPAKGILGGIRGIFTEIINGIHAFLRSLLNPSPAPAQKQTPAPTIIPTATPIPTSTSMPAPSTTLSNVKVSVAYERLNDARPKRTVDEQLQIFQDTKADMIFRASWRWQPQPNSCSDVPSAQKQACVDSGYSFEDMKNTISAIKKQNPNIIVIGAIPAQKINKNEVNEMTGETFTQTQTWAMALDPAKWGITSPTKDQIQQQLAPFSVDGYYPDITNPAVQALMLSWAERQIDSGMDGVWIDLLYTQAGKLTGITKDVNHPAVKESYEAASKLVDDIHNYGKSKGKNVYVGSWTAPMYYPYSPPKFDFVTETMGPKEMMDKKYDETKWKNTASKIKEKFGDIPLFVFLDWGFRNSPIEIFSQQMSQADAQAFLKTSDDFFTPLGMKFVYPVHGGTMVVQQTSATKLAYGQYNWYDSLAPEMNTYGTIKQLALNKTGGVILTPTPTNRTACPGADCPPVRLTANLSSVKVASVFESLSDAIPPDRNVSARVGMLSETKTDLVFRGFWRWSAAPDSPDVSWNENYVKRNYTYQALRDAISELKRQMPSSIFVGATHVIMINMTERDDWTGSETGCERTNQDTRRFSWRRQVFDF